MYVILFGVNAECFMNLCFIVAECRINYMSTCNKLHSFALINLLRFYMHTNLFHNSVESFTSFERVDSMCFYGIVHFT
jgi:hypothetical protein